MGVMTPLDEKKQQVKYDVESFDVLTEAVRELVNRFPGLRQGEKIAFATLRDNGGMALFPGDGAVVEQESRSVTGRVRQVCRYPFVVLVRGGGMTEENRASAKERLDCLGRWMGGQPVTLQEQEYRLNAYPALSGGRRFLDVSIQAPAWLYERDEHHVETWAVALAARYENIYQK